MLLYLLLSIFCSSCCIQQLYVVGRGRLIPPTGGVPLFTAQVLFVDNACIAVCAELCKKSAVLLIKKLWTCNFHDVRYFNPFTPAVLNCCCSKSSVSCWSNPPFLLCHSSACNATYGIALAILLVRLSDACIVTKRNNHLSISQHHTKQGYL